MLAQVATKNPHAVDTLAWQPLLQVLWPSTVSCSSIILFRCRSIDNHSRGRIRFPPTTVWECWSGNACVNNITTCERKLEILQADWRRSKTTFNGWKIIYFTFILRRHIKSVKKREKTTVGWESRQQARACNVVDNAIKCAVFTRALSRLVSAARSPRRLIV